MPPRRPTRTVPLVVLHGKGGIGPEHWYSWLAEQLREVRAVHLPELPHPDEPELATWQAALRELMASLPDADFDLVAHSAGALLWLHHTATRPDGLPRPARVALAGLPDEAHIASPTLQNVPLDTDAVRAAAEGTVLIGSDDDPNCKLGAATMYGVPLKMATTVVPGGGHFNPASGYGPWPAMLDWCGRDNLAFY